LKITLSFLFLTLYLHATIYEGCSTSKQEALLELSGTIKTNIQSDFEQKVKVENKDENENEDVQSTVSTYIHTATNLSLVNIQYKENASNGICAFVDKEDQIQNTKKLLSNALLYKQENIPSNGDDKIKQLSLWLQDIEQLNYLVPVFLEDSKDELAKLHKNNKIFKDLYTEALAYSESLVWKSCDNTKEGAKSKLNKQLFNNKTKEEKKGLMESFKSLFSSDVQMIDLFQEQIYSISKDKKECAVIKKEDLFAIATKMNADVQRFNTANLDTNAKKKYKQIDNYIEHLNVTKALLELYPKEFNANDFLKISNVKETLQEIKKTTYPQLVTFYIKSDQGMTMKLDDKMIENNVEYSLQIGEHNYDITTRDKCPIKGSFSLDLFEDKEISEDFNDYNYPTVLFITDKSPNIVVDTQVIVPNVVTPISKCSGDVRYLAKYASQNRDGELHLSPNKSHQIELQFLTAQELEVFNDARTKNFKTASGIKFSESLTPISSKNLTFVLKNSTTHGELDLHERGSFKYTPKKGFAGMDSFEFAIESSDETSPIKVVNITIEDSSITNFVAEEKTEKQAQESKKEATKESEEKYERFKEYVNSQEQNVEKLQKLKEKYPDMFERLLKEKLAQ